MTTPDTGDAELISQLDGLDVLREPTASEAAEAERIDPAEWHSMKEDDE